MSGSSGYGVPNPRISLGLDLEQARELGKGHALLELQQNFQSLSAEVAQVSTDLRKVLVHLREGPGRDGKKTSRGKTLSSHSLSSQKDSHPRREKETPRQQVNPLGEFAPPEFGDNLSPNLLIEWIQVLEWIFAFHGYSDEKAFEVAVLKLKGVVSLWYENIQRQRGREGRARIRTWSKLQKLITKRFLSTHSEHDLYLGVSSFSQERLGEEEGTRECEPLQNRRGGEEVTHLVLDQTVENEEAATVLLVKVDTLKEDQSLLDIKESIQGENKEKCLIQPQCTKSVQVTKLTFVTSCVSDLKRGVDNSDLPVYSCQSRGARHFTKGASHQGWPKVCSFKLGGQEHTSTPLLFARTVWDPGVGLKDFVEHLGI